MIYGDNLIDADLNALKQFHVSSHAAATVALFKPDNPAASGMVELDQSGRVSRFVEKPQAGETDAIWANAGIYLIEPGLLEAIPGGFSDFGADIFPEWIAQGRELYAAPLAGYLQDTGTRSRYLKANWDILNGFTGYSAKGRFEAGSLLGENVLLGEHAPSRAQTSSETTASSAPTPGLAGALFTKEPESATVLGSTT